DTGRAAFDILVYLSLDGNLDTGDRTVGNEAVLLPLAPNDSILVKVPIQVPALLALGAYQWIAQLDVSGTIVESSESNNLGVGNPVHVVAPPPDLRIVSGPIGAIEVNLNGNYTIAIDFKNQGAGPTQNAFDVAVYLSSDSLLDAADVEVGRSTISDKIFENTSRSLQLSVVIPQTHPLGSYWWLAVVDAAGSVSESSETNNLGLGTVTEVVEKLSDLVVSSPPVGPNGVYRRGTYKVTTQIKNQGTGANTSEFDVVIFLSEDLVVGNGDDIRVGDFAVGSVLQPDSTRTVEISVTIPALQPYRSYHWVAVLDEAAFVAELSETNNALIGLSVSVVPSPPDLAVENVTSSTPVERGHVYDISLDVVNRGDGVTTGAFQVSLFLTADDSIGNQDDVRVGTATLTGLLAAGDRKTVKLSITIPSQQALGTYRLAAVADVGKIETEKDETNNTTFSSVPVDVVPSPPDLLFVTDPAGRERVFRGVIDTVAVQIRNQGIGDASGAFDVFVFLSSDGIADSSDVQVGSVRVAVPIASGQTIDVPIPVIVPPGQPLGTYRWWARLDANRALNESDETNNDRVGVVVSIVNFPADVTIYEEHAAPTRVARGGIYQVSVPVRNLGTGPAALGFQVEIYLSEDDRLDEADFLAGVRKYSESFDSGAQQTVQVSAAVPIDLPVASYRWIGRISVVGLQDESDASNNVRLGELVTFPVMAIEPSALDFGLVRVGEARSLSFEVLNGGTARLSFSMTVTDPSLSVKPQSVSDLPAGVPWTVTVTYAPVSESSLTGTVLIKSNDLEESTTIPLLGSGQIPETNRVRLGFGLDQSQPIGTSYPAFALEEITLSLSMDEVPLLQQATLVVAYDSLRLSYADSSWFPGGVFLNAAGSKVVRSEPGVLELGISSTEILGGGSGLLGQLRFITQRPFNDGQAASVSVRRMQHQLNEGAPASIEINSIVNIQYNLACWADIHGDSLVDITDFLTFVGAFDRSSSQPGWDTILPDRPAPQTPYRRFDGNLDGTVNLSDFLLFTQAFGKRCSR
ncbi:MAG: hypothetical protein O3B73_13430, partial [bacterium]|nr:hypothetical protein [bacterium]